MVQQMIRNETSSSLLSPTFSSLKKSQHHLILPSPPRRTNKLDAHAESSFRRALSMSKRKVHEVVSGGVSGGSPTKSLSLPWNTWFRVVGGRQDQGLSLQLFRHLIRRRTKIPNGQVSDQELRRVFECIDTKSTGYMKLQQYLNWLHGRVAVVEDVMEDEEEHVSNGDGIIDVTVTL
jgi:hypothetical protein